MKSWLIDAIDQIALGEYLAESSISCGQRFGLIAVDNSIEFMLIAYVEVFKQIVGGHKRGGINKKGKRRASPSNRYSRETGNNVSRR